MTGPSGARRLTYDGVRLIEVTNPGGFTDAYVHGPGADEPLMQIDASGLNYLHADERGSVTTLSGAGGGVTAINRYDEYGVVQGGLSGRFGFTGQAFVPEIGLHYYKARMYHQDLGRFIQTDPIGFGGGPNWYGYAGGDPVNRTDPLGLRETGLPNPHVRPIDPPYVVNGDRCRVFSCDPNRRTILVGFSGERSRASGEYNNGGVNLVSDVTRGDPNPPRRTICESRLRNGSTIARNVRTIESMLERELNGAGWSNAEQAAAGGATIGFWLRSVAPGGRWAGRLGEPWGNWNYGATGRAAGIPLEVLLRGAGAAEQLEALTGPTGSGAGGEGNPLGSPPYGDKPGSQEEVRQGYNARCQ